VAAANSPAACPRCQLLLHGIAQASEQADAHSWCAVIIRAEFGVAGRAARAPHTLLLLCAQAEQLAVGRLGPGALYNESVLYSPAAPLPAHLVARVPGTTAVCFELSSIKQALGAPGERQTSVLGAPS